LLLIPDFICHCKNSFITAQSQVITARFVYRCTVFCALHFLEIIPGLTVL